MKIPAKKAKNNKTISLLVLVISIIVMIEWLFHIPSVLTIILGVPPMEFVTALCFFLLSLGVLASQKNSFLFLVLNRVTIAGVLIISLLTVDQSLFTPSSFADTSFVDNSYGLFSGRMSLATAISFFLTGISIWGMDAKSKKINRGSNYIYFLVILINFISILVFAFNIPGNDAGYLIPIPIHTSFILFWFLGFLSQKNATEDFNKLLFGKYPGSKIIRTVVPYNFTAIMVMGLALLYLINNNIVDVNPGFIVYSTMAVFAAVIYPFVVAIQLNKKEHEKNLLEKAFRASTKKITQYTEALDASSLVDITDANGTIISVNDKFCEVSKYKESELIGKTHSINSSGHHSKAFWEEVWTKISSGEVWVGSVKNKNKDGDFYWVHTAITPFKNERGEIYQFLTIRQDITTHILLAVQNETLEVKNKELEQFTYIASHDLQEPLRTVRSMINMLQEEYSNKLEEDAKFALNFMTGATDRMSDLIKGLLDYSRIGSGRELVTVDSNETVHEITKDLGAIIERKNTQITLDKLPIIKAYKIEIRLLLQNLISNAIKFQKGGVTPKVHISVQEDKDYWKFSVKDNGIGIPEKDKRNVFAIFQRLNKQSDYEGTGIGLAHCEKIVHLHGGEIWVDSIENEGSTFYFKISRNLA